MKALSIRKLFFIVVALAVALTGGGIAYALTVHQLPDTGWSKYDRNFGTWTVTSQPEFQAGVLNNVDVISSPGDVKIATSSDWLNGYAYRKSMSISAAENTYLNSGGIITTDGAYTVHTFTSGGTFTAGKDGDVEVLVVGGGGGAGRGTTNTRLNAGGGGAGGLIYIDAYTLSAGNYNVVIGSGGAGSTNTNNPGSGGSPSLFGALTANGGGGGGSSGSRNGRAGGSGGGAGVSATWFFGWIWSYGTGGSSNQPTTNDGYPNSGYGNAGGTSSASSQMGQGGGGAGAVGSGTTGGAGRTYAISGSSATYAKGGDAQSNGASGAANTGNGGNAQATNNGGNGGAGGSGIVIVRCLTSDFMSDNSQIDYQMQITVSNSSGASSGSTVYLNGASLNWPYDIRFADSSGTGLLDYWIEASDSMVATVWVEFDYIPAYPDEGLFHIYYGNADAADASNGEDAFIFFDDFSGDLSKWTKEVNGGNISIIDGYLECGGGSTSSPYGHTVLGSSTSYNGFTDGIIEGIVYLTTDSIAEVGYRGDYATNAGYKSRMDARLPIPPSTDTGLSHQVRPYVIGQWAPITTGGGPTGTPIGTDTWYPFSIRVNGSTLSISCNGQTLVGTDTSYTAAGEISLQNHYGEYSRFDNIRVRKYAALEPTWGVWGVEETPSYSMIDNTIASNVFDTGQAGARCDLLSRDESLPAGTSIIFEVRASDTTFVKSDLAPVWQDASAIPAVFGQYQQWRATLSTTDGGATPVLQEVRVLYSW